MDYDYILDGQKSNYEKFPSIHVDGKIEMGWSIIKKSLLSKVGNSSNIISIDCYAGVYIDEIVKAFCDKFTIINTQNLFKPTKEIEHLTRRYVTDDDVFGYITPLRLSDFFDAEKIMEAKAKINNSDSNFLIIGPGAFLIVQNPDVKIYADLARWEIQIRMKRKEVNGLGIINNQEPFSIQYKRGFFVDWRVCDKHKKQWFLECDYLLDTNKKDDPKLVEMATIKKGLKKTAHQPFSFVPYFDPGPWGGHWLEKVCDLESEKAPNYAWCMNCVPEENSLLFDIDGETIEIPGIDLVFFESRNLLGDAVEALFGKEFPIRFDFLDTMEGGNLSLQVHPDTTYIQENFGMHYTQDESYYLMDANEDASVYLGFREDSNIDEMFEKLKHVRDNGGSFQAEDYVNKFPANKHDHFLIPAGTIHCSGKNSMVLEISSTPYIFTFKMWDWDRLGLDGEPRPINIEHAFNVVDRTRDTKFAQEELINTTKKIGEGPGWVEEHTGLHKREFIETRRHRFSRTVTHFNNGSVNVLMLVEGREALIESPEGLFDPHIIHYAEAIVIPASIKSFSISPYGKSKGKELITIKAFVRH
jgi:mannose-6-phosphate isomerase class I